MFDATKGNKAIADQVEEGSNEFASLFDALTPRQQASLIVKMNQMAADPELVQAFIAGTYAQSNNGQQAQQLGGNAAGSPVPPVGATPSEDEQRAALQVVMNGPRLSDGMKAAILRVTNPTAGNGIKVDEYGEDKRVAALTTQLGVSNTAKDAAETKLREEKDPNKDGSLAKQLKDAIAGNTPAAMVKKADVKTLVNKIKAAAKPKNGAFGKGVEDPAKLKEGIDELDTLSS